MYAKHDRFHAKIKYVVVLCAILLSLIVPGGLSVAYNPVADPGPTPEAIKPPPPPLEPPVPPPIDTSGPEVNIIIVLKEQPMAEVSPQVRAEYEARVETISAQMRELSPSLIAEGRSLTREQEQALERDIPQVSSDQRDRAAALSAEMDATLQAMRQEAVARAMPRIRASQAPLVEFIQSAGGKVLSQPITLNAVVAILPTEQLAAVQGRPDVAVVSQNGVSEAHLNVSVPSIYASTWWSNGFTGGAWDIGIIDSGIEDAHNAFSTHVKYQQRFGATADAQPPWAACPTWNPAVLDPTFDDVNGHGSHVAGISSGDDTPYRGVAYGHDALLNLKAGFDCDGNDGGGAFMFWGDGMDAADWGFFTAFDDADVLNLSYGGYNSTDYTTYAQFWDAMVDENLMPICMSAGNDGPGDDTVGNPSTAYNVFSVAASDDQGTTSRADDTIRTTSSRGYSPAGRKKPDITFPGDLIYSVDNSSTTGYINMGGTSMASPHCAGAVALMLDYGIGDPRASKAVLINTAEDRSTAGWDRAWGWGYADLSHAYTHKDDYFVSTIAPSPAFKLYKGPAYNGDTATLVWNRRVDYIGSTYPSTVYNLSDLDLVLYREDTGAWVDSSTSVIDNVEQVEADGTYPSVVKVDAWSGSFHGATSEVYALATEESFVLASGPTLGLGTTNYEELINVTFPVDVVVSNTGDLDAHDVNVSLSLPAGLSLISGANPQNLGSIADGTNKTASWTVQGTALGSYSVPVNVSSSSYGQIWTASGSFGANIVGPHTHLGETWSGSGLGLNLYSSNDHGLYAKSRQVSSWTYGAYGQTDSSSGWGAYGFSFAGTGTNYGVYGKTKASSGIGVRGSAASLSGLTFGILGESSSTSGRGVAGLATANTGLNYGLLGESISDLGAGVEAIASAATGNTIGVVAQVQSPNGWAGQFLSSVGNGIFVSVPAGQWGLNVASGTKNAVVATEDGARLLYAEEATEVWFTDYGVAQLQDGVATVAIDPIYAQTVNLAEPYHVFLQAYDDAALYVSRRTAAGFEVRLRADDLSAGEADATFFYRIVAKRLGHGGRRLERAPWADDDPNLFPESGTGWPTDTPRETLPSKPAGPPSEIVGGSGRPASGGNAGSVSDRAETQQRPVPALVDVRTIQGAAAPPFDPALAHDHWGEYWNGTGTGLTLISKDAHGLLGISQATAGWWWGLYGTSASTIGRGIFGYATSTSGAAWGINGSSNSDGGRGVFGLASSGTGANYGVLGISLSTQGRGVYGTDGVLSAFTCGVFGESQSTKGRGALGSATATSGSTIGVLGRTAAPNGWAGWFTSNAGKGVYISVPAGKMGLNVASGLKNAVVATDDGARLLYAEEATEVWFSDYGFAQLQDGAATMAIDPIYAQTVNLAEPYHVFLQVYGDAELQVGQRTAAGFEVRLGEGDPNVAFSYRVVARRLGHEGRRLERAPWADDDPNLYPQQPPAGVREEMWDTLAPHQHPEKESGPEIVNPASKPAVPAQDGIATDGANVRGSSSYGGSSNVDGSTAVHDHWGETWLGYGNGLTLVSTNADAIYAQTGAASTASFGIFGANRSSGGDGVRGVATAPTGPAYGVVGESLSTKGRGVFGRAIHGTGTTYGAFGSNASTSGCGVAGYATASSGTTYGIIGRSSSISGVGIYGNSLAAAGTPIGVFGAVNSPTGWAAKFLTSQGNGVYVSVPAGKMGLNVASGTKNAVVATQDGARLLYAEEAAEVWFADYGFAQLQDGVAIVALDSVFGQTVNLAEGYHVSVQAYGNATVYVSQRAPDQFEVRLRADDLSAGDPDATFSYRLVARRLGYEQERLARAPWADDDPNLFPERGMDWAVLEGSGNIPEPEETEPDMEELDTVE